MDKVFNFGSSEDITLTSPVFFFSSDDIVSLAS